MFLFKLLKLTLILLSIYFFRLNIIEFTNSKLLGNLCLLLLLIFFFQFREWHDPILGFAILIPLICFFFFSSLYYYQFYLGNNKKKFLYISIFLFLCLLLTYEISYPLIVLYIIICFFKSGSLKNIFKSLKWHFLILIIIIFVTIYFRLNVGEKSYPSLDGNFVIVDFFKALGIQMYSGLSFSYFPRLNVNFIENLELIDLVIFFYFSVMFFLFKKIENSKINYFLIFKLLTIGLILVLTQSFMVAISGHKKDLINMGLGFGYLPVLLEYFGFSIIYLSLILVIFLKIKNEYIKISCVYFFAFVLV